MVLFKLIPLLLLVGCESFTREFSDDVSSTRIVYSEAGGMWSVLSGRVSSCTVITSNGVMVVKEMIFDASENKCSAKVGPKDD